MVFCSIPAILNALAVYSYLAALKGIPTSGGSCLGSSGVMIMVGLSCSIIEAMIAVATVLCETSDSAGFITTTKSKPYIWAALRREIPPFSTKGRNIMAGPEGQSNTSSTIHHDFAAIGLGYSAEVYWDSERR
ncbi:hypothetical protein BDP55DRAFT_678465 [Colletotrichum godetiae]|uniref:Uncharacterized protein n=1 Tax=Colletotrichum godetiae TaxID=1209918 RepID=A0AAJ0ADN8_9PEZI|nr:uncharacterized protein BDP55DRAFT_678465 [Colletotrichum godetiae]KAK1659797.1 hypothetical protein BDP55DRAFT_678465 [Colletotrichum godetiae]